MINPLFWLALSFLLVSISLTVVLVVLVPTVIELSRAARSVEKLCDTLSRELPPTLESIRLTSLEITELTDDMTEGVQNASRVAQKVDHSVSNVRKQAQRMQVSTRSVLVGVRAAWKTLTRPNLRDRRRLSPGKTPAVNSLPTQSEVSRSSHPSGHSRFAPHPPVSLAEEATAAAASQRSPNTAEAGLAPSTAANPSTDLESPPTSDRD
ncbi:MAG: DUF948 domain-containing protein [Leptolyngbya sp. SIO1E4]|nr:DUF948 domain-containing protein [Leptolyngbya sp. SIO1E4]